MASATATTLKESFMPDPRPTDTNWDRIAPRPFKIDVPQGALDDLKARLARVRWPDEISGQAWQFGTDLLYLKSLCAYWKDQYDWRAQETQINLFKQFKVSIGGCDLHYICEQGEGANPRPLLLTHGWPGSFYEYHKLIPRLTHPSRYGGSPDDAFTVVVPSMPGHGFSFRENQPRFGLTEIADSLKTLMVDVLGHRLFAAHVMTGAPLLRPASVTRTPRTFQASTSRCWPYRAGRHRIRRARRTRRAFNGNSITGCARRPATRR
jgi:Epoxide hydrolase N terminus